VPRAVSLLRFKFLYFKISGEWLSAFAGVSVLSACVERPICAVKVAAVYAKIGKSA
jgi:hypothetical protein